VPLPCAFSEQGWGFHDAAPVLTWPNIRVTHTNRLVAGASAVGRNQRVPRNFCAREAKIRRGVTSGERFTYRNTIPVKSFSPWNHGFWYFILLMSWRRVPYLGTSPFLLNPSMRLVPVRLFIFRLQPVDDGRFITPVQQTRHHLPMRAGKHERLHRLFCCPQGSSPKCQVSVAQ